MPYAHRAIHDADAHVMEMPDWLAPHADPAFADRLAAIEIGGVSPEEQERLSKFQTLHRDPEYRRKDEDELLLRKNWAATGSFLKEDRPRAIDLLGFKSQLIFNTFLNGALLKAERDEDVDYAYAFARAHNRAMADFCSADPRLLGTGYVPLRDFERAAKAAAETIELGCKALLVPSGCPRGHAHSHPGLDAVWARAEEAGLPVVFHVGGGLRQIDNCLLDADYIRNGGPPILDFHGGDENFRSVDYMAIPTAPMQTLATMIFDGVLDRFPNLRIGVIEQGASWVPSWMRFMDSSFDAFRKGEERLQKLSLRPSEFVKRQVRVTPYPAEDVGWIIAQSGESIALFSSDYPHVEGGRHPLGRFESSLADTPEPARHRFYHDNFVDLMGRGLDELPPPNNPSP